MLVQTKLTLSKICSKVLTSENKSMGIIGIYVLWSVDIVATEAWMREPVAGEYATYQREPAKFIVMGFTQEYQKHFLANTSNYTGRMTADCCEKMRVIFEWDKLRLNDIKYSFIIGQDGMVYEGRGWNLSPLLPMKMQNVAPWSLSIAFMHPLENGKPSKEMLDARENLIRFGVANNLISPQVHEISLFNRVMWGTMRKLLSRIY